MSEIVQTVSAPERLCAALGCPDPAPSLRDQFCDYHLGWHEALAHATKIIQREAPLK